MGVEALYIHVPFCASKCLYCDFDSRACLDGGAHARYCAGLLESLEGLKDASALDGCTTAYMGGGTPTVLGALLPELASRIRAAAPSLVEFTCEANPESFDGGMAAALAASGVTRVSFGVQSFSDVELATIGRIHTASAARAAVKAALDAGLDVSVDLMCGIPLQTVETWERSVLQAIGLGVGHVSVYPLTLEEGTPLARAAERDASLVPDDDMQATCMERARSMLTAAGLAPYEVASYARPGKECRHNIAYWTGASYLGLGRSAASMLDAATYERLRRALGADALPSGASRVRLVQLGDGFPPCASYDVEHLSAREAAAEDLMLSMRMTAGAAPALLRKAGRLLGDDRVRDAAGRSVALGLASWEKDGACCRLAPTERGWLMGNELYELFWDLACDPGR